MGKEAPTCWQAGTPLVPPPPQRGGGGGTQEAPTHPPTTKTNMHHSRGSFSWDFQQFRGCCSDGIFQGISPTQSAIPNGANYAALHCSLHGSLQCRQQEPALKRHTTAHTCIRKPTLLKNHCTVVDNNVDTSALLQNIDADSNQQRMPKCDGRTSLREEACGEPRRQLGCALYPPLHSCGNNSAVNSVGQEFTRPHPKTMEWGSVVPNCGVSFVETLVLAGY